LGSSLAIATLSVNGQPLQELSGEDEKSHHGIVEHHQKDEQISYLGARAPKSDISVFKESNANITRKTHATKATTLQKEPGSPRLLERIPSRCAGWCWAISGYLAEILTKLEPSPNRHGYSRFVNCYSHCSNTRRRTN
jgi:hypothetical protein